jgi:hypothetical protein
MTYIKFYSDKITNKENSNKTIILRIWDFIVSGGNYTKKECKGKVEYYESVYKKLKHYPQQYNKTQVELCSEFLTYKDIVLDQTLDNWNIKAERQNVNEPWKKEYIEKHSKIKIFILPKSKKNSLVLSESFDIIEKKDKKTQSEKSKGMKSFDFIIKDSKYPNTNGFDGILTVDKTVKVTGGSQMNTQKEIDRDIKHLSSDPQGRHYLILLDGEFWSKYIIEHQGKYPNVHITNSDELIK